MKTCSKCNISKSKTLFSKNSKNKDGLQHKCKDCLKAYNTAWSEANTEKFKDYNKTSNKNWYDKNADKCRAGQKQRRIAHPEQHLARAAFRRALKLKATPSWEQFEKIEIRNLYKHARELTEATGVEYHVDHIVPLNSDIVQGFHCFANLQVISADVNLSKSNQFWPDMP